MALAALDGVGDPALGEWRQRGAKFVHVRRRLALAEQGDLQVRDIRGTQEEEDRLIRVLIDCPYLEPLLRP